jgi:hypothetical protein
MQHPEAHDLTALAYGMIEGPEREQLLAHLSTCDACRELYDSFRTEQADVRDSIMRDARSGASEARALEATLGMLKAIDTPAPRGRLLRIPMWFIAAEVAAVLAVAVALLFVLKPSDDPELVPVADAARAPANVDGGVVYVSDRKGDWLPADGVPLDEIVKAGDGQILRLTMADGSRAVLEPGSLFRVGYDTINHGRPLVYLLSGDGEIDTADAPENVFVLAGETGFLAMPNARFALKLERENTAMPARVMAQVMNGDVVAWPEHAGFTPVAMQHGERGEWTPEGMRLFEAGSARFMLVNDLNSEQIKRFDSIIGRLSVADMPKADPRALHLRRTLEVRREAFEVGNQVVEIKVRATSMDKFVFAANDESLTLSSNGTSLVMTLLAKSGSSQFERRSFDELLPLVPEQFIEDVRKLEARHDSNGKLRITRVPD